VLILSEANNLKFWELVMNVKTFKRSADSITDKTINDVVVAAANQPFKLVEEPRPEVLALARFIANIEPSYINSEGRYVTFSMLRSIPAYSKDDLEFLQDKFMEIIKGVVVSGAETGVVGRSFRVNTTMTKPKLIKAALSHLLTGSEIFKDIKDFKTLLSHSCLVSKHKVSYAYMVGVALALDYRSVPDMLSDFAITFVDQADNLRHVGRLVFYDGSVRTEVL
jgi:hypothetical protein